MDLLMFLLWGFFAVTVTYHWNPWYSLIEANYSFHPLSIRKHAMNFSEPPFKPIGSECFIYSIVQLQQ